MVNLSGPPLPDALAHLVLYDSHLVHDAVEGLGTTDADVFELLQFVGRGGTQGDFHQGSHLAERGTQGDFHQGSHLVALVGIVGHVGTQGDFNQGSH